MSRIEVHHEPEADWLGDSALDMLRRIGGAGAVFVRGEDPSRTRALVTLLHGNEPSGVRAMHAWLRRAHRPAVSCLWIVGAVEAALAAPAFSHRHLRSRRDLNRCFREPFEDEEGAVARAIVDLLVEVAPEAVIDLHNNTGHNPPYGIATRSDAEHRGLTAWWAKSLVESDLDLGALVEVSTHGAPSVTIECGLAGDPAADAVALHGAEAFLASESLTPTGSSQIDVYTEPVRVTLLPETTLAIGASPQESVELTLAADVDRHNWRRMGEGTPIGWVRTPSRFPVAAVRPDGEDIAHDLFTLDGDVLCARRPFIPIMITTDAGIAASDCLFYVVNEEPRE